MPDPRYAHCPACAGGRPDCPRCDGEGIVERPSLIGRIAVHGSEYAGMTLRREVPADPTKPWTIEGPVTLYAWSDGIVTWTKGRMDIGAA